MKYLVTGGAGFIGSHLCDRLISQGHHVQVLDNLSTGRLTNISHLLHHERFAYTIGDILDLQALAPLVPQCDRVIHLAAAVGVKLIMENPVETILTNVRGTENVLSLAAQHDKPVVIASTSEVYGKLMESNNDIAALREDGDWRLGPTSKRRWAYACSKAMDEFLALAYFDEKRLPTLIIRFFNTVGPRQTGQYGMVIPAFVQKALLNEPIVVYGDGEQTRCFNHVLDAVDGITRLMDEPGAFGQVYNVGNDKEISMNALAERVRELADSSSRIVHVPYEQVFARGFEDMMRRTPDLTKIRGVIPYEPRHSVDDIIHGVIDYYRHQPTAV